MREAILSIDGLSKTYASGFRALKDISLEIRRGEIFALLGPNGAGKTTLVVFGGMRIPLPVYDDFSEDAIKAFLAALDTPEASRTDAQRALIAQPRIGYELANWDGFLRPANACWRWRTPPTRTWWCSRASRPPR
jgi:ABC-type phosphonate transport system ATPase subunit